MQVLILGTGGNAREVGALIKSINKVQGICKYEIIGYCAQEDDEIGTQIGEYKVITSDNNASDFCAAYEKLGVIIPMGTAVLKKKAYESIWGKMPNVEFPNIIHTSAQLLDTDTIRIGYGCIICANVTLTTNITIGNFVYINNNCSIGHDTSIGDYSVINPMASVSGNVSIGEGALVGGHSAIMQGLKIGEHAKIGLGAFVINDVAPNTTMICNSAHAVLRGCNDAEL